MEKQNIPDIRHIYKYQVHLMLLKAGFFNVSKH